LKSSAITGVFFKSSQTITESYKILGVNEISPSNYISMALQPFVGPWPLFQFLIFYTVGRTPWMGDQPVARLLPAHRTAKPQNKHTQISTPQVGFEPMIPVFERVNTVHALDRVASVISSPSNYFTQITMDQ
jgi:hypothetical protein